jgi:pyridoxal phosphate enzyme (YggS family)
MSDAPERIAQNLARLRETIAQAAHRAARRPEEIKIIAVSKNQPRAAIEAAVRAGQNIFGESTMQEALTKMAPFQGQALEWHFIGHLQSNKARFIPGNFQWLHSLDSVSLASRVSRFAQEKNTVIHTLIEVNVTRDSAKHGVLPGGVAPLLEQLLKENLAGIALRGLMAIGPHPATETEVRAAFAAVRQLRDECRRRFALPGFTELSMGMSGDYREAIREGATLVRIGSAIFGERFYAGG